MLLQCLTQIQISLAQAIKKTLRSLGMARYQNQAVINRLLLEYVQAQVCKYSLSPIYKLQKKKMSLYRITYLLFYGQDLKQLLPIFKSESPDYLKQGTKSTSTCFANGFKFVTKTTNVTPDPIAHYPLESLMQEIPGSQIHCVFIVPRKATCRPALQPLRSQGDKSVDELKDFTWAIAPMAQLHS